MMCSPIVIDGEQAGWLCGSQLGQHPPRCRFCDNWSELQCDGPKPGKKSGTCDAHLCRGHARTLPRKQFVNGKDDTVDLCPKCSAADFKAMDDAREP